METTNFATVGEVRPASQNDSNSIVPRVWNALAVSGAGLRAHYAASTSGGVVAEVACRNDGGDWRALDAGATERLCQSCARLVDADEVAGVEQVGFFSATVVDGDDDE